MSDAAAEVTNTTVAAPKEERAATRPKGARSARPRQDPTARPKRQAGATARKRERSAETKRRAPAKPASKPQSAATPRARSATATRTARLPQPAQPRGIPSASPPRRRPPETDTRPGTTPIFKTAAQATAELAEIGLALGTRALRRAIDRLPRP